MKKIILSVSLVFGILTSKAQQKDTSTFYLDSATVVFINTLAEYLNEATEYVYGKFTKDQYEAISTYNNVVIQLIKDKRKKPKR